MSNVKERRRYIRTELPILVVLRVRDGSTIEEIKSHTKNISAMGMMIELEKKIAVNTQVELSLTPPNTANPIHIAARVVRSEKIEGKNVFNIGIEFTKIEEDNKNTFLKFLCDTIYKI